VSLSRTVCFGLVNRNLVGHFLSTGLLLMSQLTSQCLVDYEKQLFTCTALV